MFACAAGHHEVVRRLVKVPGINLTQKDSIGWTALHLAAIHGRSDCLQELAKVVDDWNCRSFLGETPLYAALYIGHPDSVRIIVSQPGVDFSVKTNTVNLIHFLKFYK